MGMKFLRGMEETLREKIRLLIFLGSWNPNFVNKSRKENSQQWFGLVKRALRTSTHHQSIRITICGDSHMG